MSEIKTPRKILVVDDEPEIRAFLSELLSVSGEFTVFQASNLSDALQFVRENDDLDALLLDLILPDAKGVDALRKMKEQNQQIPIIVVTGYPGLSEHTIAMGASEHCEKPFSSSEIEFYVRKTIEAAK